VYANSKRRIAVFF